VGRDPKGGRTIAEIRRAAPFLSGITVSGGEATQQPEFVRALFRAVKADPSLQRLSCFVDSNGATDRATWASLVPVMDGAMIDLKCFDPKIHLAMTGQPNEQVLESIRYLDAVDRLYEVRLLLIAGVNDDSQLLDRTARWLADLNPLMRVKLIGFRAHGVRSHAQGLTEPTADQMRAHADLFAARGPFNVCVV
jgi:pyruvate-formate lyase-activating enzyme